MGRMKDLYMDIEDKLTKNLGRKPTQEEIENFYENLIKEHENFDDFINDEALIAGVKWLH